ncbi:MAG: hypothetical protein NT094_04620 [Candidatus Staskawiczbacteria bacterium]|nr:hypothetical protein [Candidatus Staskawiczbacteria bacterium]
MGLFNFLFKPTFDKKDVCETERRIEEEFDIMNAGFEEHIATLSKGLGLKDRTIQILKNLPEDEEVYWRLKRKYENDIQKRGELTNDWAAYINLQKSIPLMLITYSNTKEGDRMERNTCAQMEEIRKKFDKLLGE